MENLYEDAYLIKYPEGDVSLERNTYTPSLGMQLRTHTVKEEETIQSIAFRYYGDSGAWYKIADVNGIYNPFEEVVEGLVLIIPY